MIAPACTLHLEIKQSQSAGSRKEHWAKFYFTDYLPQAGDEIKLFMPPKDENGIETSQPYAHVQRREWDTDGHVHVYLRPVSMEWYIWGNFHSGILKTYGWDLIDTE